MINKIQKAREYAEQPERVTFHTLTVEFRGDNSTYQLSLSPDGWSCSCPGFRKFGICPHVMAVEKLFKPMLKRSPIPYAPGQNIVSDVKKAKRYSEEMDRIRILAFSASVQGDNHEQDVTYDNGLWESTAHYFQLHGICSYTMTLERILKGMVQPITMESPLMEAE